MNRTEAIAALSQCDEMKECEWLVSLGYSLTIAARASYPTETEPGRIEALIGCNEMQHQVLQRLAHVHTGDAWPVEAFLDTLAGLATANGVLGDFQLALSSSMRLLL